MFCFVFVRDLGGIQRIDSKTHACAKCLKRSVFSVNVYPKCLAIQGCCVPKHNPACQLQFANRICDLSPSGIVGENVL